MYLDIGRNIYFGQFKGNREKGWVTEMKEMWKSQIQADQNLYLPRSRDGTGTQAHQDPAASVG